MTLGRVFKDATQAARGRRAARYEIEVIPYFCGEIPDDVQRVLFAWERGPKLFVTDAEKVNPNTHAVFFKQYLRQKATIYMEGHDVKPKEFSFKIQAVTKGSKGEDERKTIGKVKVDLAQYCDGQVNPEPQDLFLQCKPVGKLKVSVKAVWLKDDSVDPDALTEAGTELTDWTEASATGRSKKAGPGRSNMSKKKQPQQAQEEEEDAEEDAHADEQDLSGFDHHRDGSSGAHHDGPRGDGEEEGRRPRSGKNRRHRQQGPEEGGIPEGQEPGEEEGEEQPHPRSSEPGEGQAASTKGQGGSGKSAAGAEEEYITEGDRIHKPSWRDYVCCCCGPHPTVADVHETSNLLSEKQATAMDQMNDTTPVEHKKKRKKKRRHHHPEDAAAGVAGVAGPEADAAPQAHPARQPTPQRQTQRQQRPGHER